MSESDPIRTLVRHPLFSGVPAAAVEELRGLVLRRQLSAGEALCRRGDEGDSLFVILSGLAQVLVGDAAAAKLRRGDVVGEMSLLTGERRSATVVAAVPMSVLELDRDAFAQLMARHPSILGNLTRILSERLRETTARVGVRPTRGEAVALVAGDGSAVVPELVEATRTASARAVAVLDAQSSPEEALARLDDALAENGLVLLLGDLAQETLPALIDAADPTVAIVASAGEAAQLGALHEQSARGETIEVVVLRRRGEAAPSLGESMQLARSVDRDGGGEPLAAADALWLGRHIARTKLGLALGAGGAKGYAHIGVLHALEDAGHVVDSLAGSSIGAIVGVWLGLGMSAAEVEATMRSTFSPETVEAMFQRSFTGTATGLHALERAFRESTHDATFDDLCLPLVVMTVDLNSRQPAPVTEGPLWEALLAATALAGVFPPFERDGKRLVDGLALVPVPTDAVHELGADVSLSVNLIPRHTLDAWPGGDVPPEPPRLSGSRTLASLLEVMDLGQLEASERQAARADVVVTPTFGPSTWRDFHLADLFVRAGWEAAEAERPTLEKLVSPQLTPSRLST